jgi:N6-adenosine-specific RNA methylase IME4
MREGKGTVIVDPPWPYEAASPTRVRQYPTVSIDELAELPIAELGNYLFLWTTGPFLSDACDLIRQWGFEQVTWIPKINVKQVAREPGTERIVFASSYGNGFWFHGAVEACLVACRPHARTIRTNYLGLLCDNARHSRKPDALHTVIEQHYPRPYVELFARRQRCGWIGLGDELDGQDIRDSVAAYLRTGELPPQLNRRKGFLRMTPEDDNA